jgi:hypothetical protein
MDTQPHKGGRPKKQETGEVFMGFTQASIHNEYFRMPTMWLNVCAEIDNLAELKVVQYVLRHTWGFRDYEGMKQITLDEFVNGRKFANGDRMDMGTGLSKDAVIAGLKRAIKHGFLVCVIDDRDRARIKKYYALKLAEESTEVPPQEETEVDNNEYNEVVNADEVVFNDSNEGLKTTAIEERTSEQTQRTMDIRIPHPSKSFEEDNSTFPSSINPQRGKYPAFIQRLIADFSAEYGDDEHIRSNISQANNIYQQSGMSEQEFTEVIYAAIATAKRACVRKLNAKGRPNRVPYFFRCLKQMTELVPAG